MLLPSKETDKNYINSEGISAGFPFGGITCPRIEEIYKLVFDWSRAFKGISIPY